MSNLPNENNTAKKSEIPINNAVIETPAMTEEEMKNFLSTITKVETLQGEYVFNGFLYFFETVTQTIKKNPIEASNLLFHLQLHVFNNLMWESYHAFDSQRKKAHLIFNRTEPFLNEDFEKSPDLSDSSVEDLSAAFSTLMNNPHLPKKLFNILSDEFAEISVNTNSPENILFNLQKMDKEEDSE